MSNRHQNVYDTGAEAAGVTEAAIVMRWANALRIILMRKGHLVVRTRVDDSDPCPVSRRDDVASAYKCERMISLHCNAADGKASGTETFYRGEDDKEMAVNLTAAVCRVLSTKNRGAKTEKESQHPSLAVMEFDKCWLVELGFIDNTADRERLLNFQLMIDACNAIADVITR